MTEEVSGVALTDAPSNAQRTFVRYLQGTLIDLTVLMLFAEHWALVTINSFTIAIFAAFLLQVLLKITIRLEHAVGGFFRARSDAASTFLRYFSAWLILFGSKFVMLGAIDFAFGDDVLFTGPLHGVVAFIVVVVTMLAAEEIGLRIYRRLGNTVITK